VLALIVPIFFSAFLTFATWAYLKESNITMWHRPLGHDPSWYDLAYAMSTSSQEMFLATAFVAYLVLIALGLAVLLLVAFVTRKIVG